MPKVGNPLVSPCIVCYAENEEKPFWLSSLGQMIQFGTIKLRTFKNYFGQFVWIEKSHCNSRVSLHEAPTKNVIINKPGTAKVGAISKVQNCKRGTLWAL